MCRGGITIVRRTSERRRVEKDLVYFNERRGLFSHAMLNNEVQPKKKKTAETNPVL